MGVLRGWPFGLVLERPSMYKHHLFLYTSVTFPECPLLLPLTIVTSSSFLTGIDLMLCLALSSLLRFILMSLYLKWEGALKWALLFFLLEDVTWACDFIVYLN